MAPPARPDALAAERHDGVLWLRKSNPAARDGIDLAMMGALESTIAEASADASLRAMVIDSASGFHGGAVLVTELAPDLATLGRDDFQALVERGHALGRAIARLPFPVIAIARRGALGGGLELLLRADFVYCTDEARFNFPEVTLGLVAAWGGTQLAGRLAPLRRAQEMLLLGEPVRGRQAEDWGLVTRSFPDERALDLHVQSVLRRLRTCSPASLRWTKRCLAAVWEGPLAHGEAVEQQAETEAMASAEFLPALAAAAEGKRFDFIDRRPVDRT